jgi:hypothetical protein
MANCPNCGSDHITLKRESNVNWGRAVAGWALFGALGGAVGAVTGEDRSANACLNCGTSWNAADLYKVIQVIKSSTGVNLDLTSEGDRLYLNNFISEMGPHMAALAEAEQKANLVIKAAENKAFEAAGSGVSWGCLVSIVFMFFASFLGGWVILIMIAAPIVGYLIGRSEDRASKRAHEERLKNAEAEASKIKSEAGQVLRREGRLFAKRYPRS